MGTRRGGGGGRSARPAANRAEKQRAINPATGQVSGGSLASVANARSVGQAAVQEQGSRLKAAQALLAGRATRRRLTQRTAERRGAEALSSTRGIPAGTRGEIRQVSERNIANARLDAPNGLGPRETAGRVRNIRQGIADAVRRNNPGASPAERRSATASALNQLRSDRARRRSVNRLNNRRSAARGEQAQAQTESMKAAQRVASERLANNAARRNAVGILNAQSTQVPGRTNREAIGSAISTGSTRVQGVRNARGRAILAAQQQFPDLSTTGQKKAAAAALNTVRKDRQAIRKEIVGRAAAELAPNLLRRREIMNAAITADGRAGIRQVRTSLLNDAKRLGAGFVPAVQRTAAAKALNQLRNERGAARAAKRSENARIARARGLTIPSAVNARAATFAATEKAIKAMGPNGTLQTVRAQAAATLNAVRQQRAQARNNAAGAQIAGTPLVRLGVRLGGELGGVAGVRAARDVVLKAAQGRGAGRGAAAVALNTLRNQRNIERRRNQELSNADKALATPRRERRAVLSPRAQAEKILGGSSQFGGSTRKTALDTALRDRRARRYSARDVIVADVEDALGLSATKGQKRQIAAVALNIIRNERNQRRRRTG